MRVRKNYLGERRFRWTQENVRYWVVYCTGVSSVFRGGRVAGYVVAEVQIVKLPKLWPEYRELNI
jgi:hypothetical protein